MNVKYVQIMNIRVDRDVHFMNSFHVKRPKTGLFVRGEPIHPDCGSVPESKPESTQESVPEFGMKSDPESGISPINFLNSPRDIPGYFLRIC
jgi:hypothetical protein